jgi:DNA-binding transcriptional LysR family regulator
VAALEARPGGPLRIRSSVAFGRRVLTPLVLEFMRQHPELQGDLRLGDRCASLVGPGRDVAVRRAAPQSRP